MISQSIYAFQKFFVGGANILAIATTPPPENFTLAPPKAELAPTYWEQHHVLIILTVVAATLALLTVIFLLLRTHTQTLEPVEISARRTLEKLRDQKEDGAVIMTVSKTLKHFVLSMFNLPAVELTTTEFDAELKSCETIKPELAKDIVTFLRECDRVKFSPKPSTKPIDAAKNALLIVDSVLAQRKEAEKTSVANPAHR